MARISTNDVRSKVTKRYPKPKEKDMSPTEKKEFEKKREKYKAELDDEKAQIIERKKFSSEAYDDYAE